MRPLERVGHAPGGDAKRFHNECPEDKGQYESGYQPLESVCNFGRSVFLLLRRLIVSVFSSLVWRHKCQSCLGTLRRQFHSQNKNIDYACKSSQGQ
jgi:hypothetical protein